MCVVGVGVDIKGPPSSTPLYIFSSSLKWVTPPSNIFFPASLTGEPGKIVLQKGFIRYIIKVEGRAGRMRQSLWDKGYGSYAGEGCKKCGHVTFRHERYWNSELGQDCYKIVELPCENPSCKEGRQMEMMGMEVKTRDTMIVAKECLAEVVRLFKQADYEVVILRKLNVDYYILKIEWAEESPESPRKE